MIKARLQSVIFVLLGISLVLSPVLVLSQQANSDDEFNPNYLISDEEMQFAGSMTRADIQAFLDDYNSYLADFRADDLDGTRRLASDIIYRAAQEHKINPKYLLVKLQKEQSLITATSPTQKQLNGATGYGITDGCGWSCSSYLNNKGFGKQVDSAAGIIRWYYDRVNIEPWIKRPGQSTIIDGQLVVPENYATAFLYTYTPHIQGNKNFWILWNKWFGQVFPDGTLARGYTDANVYLIQDGEKRKIKSMAVLMTRFDPKMIIKIPDSELNNIPDGSKIALPNYSILKQGTKYYLVDFDTIRPFANYDVIKSFGYHPDEIINVTTADIKGYRVGALIKNTTYNPTGRLVRTIETKKLYYIKDNKYYPITDEQIAKINFPNLLEENINITEMQDYAMGEITKFKNGTLIGITGSNKIYVIENNKKRHIASEDVYNAYGWDWNNIVWTDQITGINHSTGQPIYLPSRLADPNTTQITTTLETSDTITENGKMYAVTENKTEYTGLNFETSLNTYLVADYATKEILSGKNIDTIRPAASLTKVLTAYRLMKEGLRLTKSTTYEPHDHKAIYHSFRIVEGEKILNQHLFHALLISSLNTPARMLVDSVEENENTFIKGMNNQLKTWGLTKSKFVDPYGYDLNNQTTAREYLTIYTNSEKNKEVRDTLSMKGYEYNELVDLDGKPTHYDYHSNELVNTAGLPFKIISSKTGYLDEAGSCLTMLIERDKDGRKFVIITMGNPDYNNRFEEPKDLAVWTINNF
jgi:D-alanyl-D-alanine carboxypeptidase